jgi:hypothetical protein
MTNMMEPDDMIAPNAERSRFFNFVLVWILFANIGFMALWFSGAPPRQFEIALAGVVGLIVKRFPFPVRYLSFVSLMLFSVLKFISGLFNLTLGSLLYSVQFFAEMQPGSSVDYSIAGLAILVIMVIAFALIKRDANFTKPVLLLSAVALVLGVAGLDYYMGRGMRGHYFRTAPEGAPFASAVSKSGFLTRADGKRNLVLVIVESLGEPRGNAEIQRLLFAHYKNSAAVHARYDIIQGIAPYYNSTTSGEIRELCGRWGDYYDLLTRKDTGCVPATLSKKGFDTVAMHSFVGAFFKRENWYPHIGFATRNFAPELSKQGARNCGGVFPGVCDRDVPKIMAERLKAAKKPTFLYWLTLNSHLPVPPGLNLDVDHCERVSPKLAVEFPQICRQFTIYNDIDVAMVKEITAVDFPTSDILMVGDHMPPYFDRHHRTQFNPENVPWLYLRAKDGQ